MTDTPIARAQERRAEWHTPQDCYNMIAVNKKFDDGTERMGRIEGSIDAVGKKLDDHIETSKSTNEGVAEVLTILNAAKGFFKVVGWISVFAKWALAIGIPVLTFLHLIKGGGTK